MSQYSEEQIVDVEKRTKEVGQILGDPTLFPVEFLSWLKRYLEQSGIQLPLSSIIGGFQPGGGSVRNLAAGLFILYGGPSAPPGSVACLGQALSRTEYGLLFEAIGTTWGTPPDSSTFLAPDARDRALFGAGGVLSVGQTDGQPYGSRSGARHRHTVIDPQHDHEGWLPGGGSSYGTTTSGNESGTTPWVLPAATNIRVGPDGTNLDAPNFLGVLVAITTGQ